jgi:protocatechuate 3,4-dioxygenase beta subunit
MSTPLLKKTSIVFIVYGFLLAAITIVLNTNLNDLTEFAVAQNFNLNASPPLQQQQASPLPAPSVSASQTPSPFQQSGPPPMKPLSPLQMASSANLTCVLTPSLIETEGTPQQIEGPYFVAGMPNRSDIRSDTSDGSVQEGVPLHLVVHVYQSDSKDQGGVNNNTNANVCTPLSGARVDIWHANAQGLYSGVKDSGTGGKTFLRGYQLTDSNGTATFDTVYPGWYEGRAIHIHIKVTAFDGAREKLDWTSQFYLNNSANEQVHTQPPYSNHGPVPVTNEQDFIFTGPSTDGLVKTDAGKHLMLDLTKQGEGYTGTFNVVVNSTGSIQQ